MNNASAPAQGHKRKSSYGDINEIAKCKNVLSKVDEAYQRMKELKTEFYDAEEVSRLLEDQMVELERRIKDLEARKDSKTVACSRLTWDDLKRMDIRCQIARWRDSYWRDSKTRWTKIPVDQNPWTSMTAVEDVLYGLADLSKYCRTNLPEAGSRMTVDRVLVGSVKLVRLHEEDLEGIVVLLEQPLASESVCIESNDGTKCTWLSARLDYVTMAYDSMQPIVVAHVLSGTAGSNSEDLHQVQGRFCLIEAKRRLDSNGMAVDLRKHLPEAVGQCAAWCEKSRTELIHFCLTNGFQWQFGVYDHELNNRRYSIFRVLQLPTDITGTPVETSSREVTLEHLMTLISDWLVLRPDEAQLNYITEQESD